MKNKVTIKKTRTRHKKLKLRVWYFFLIAGILCLSYIFLIGNHGLIKYYQLQKRKEELIQQISFLKQEQARLQREIDMLTNNYRYIEKIAREKYQMGKKGEKIYFMIPPSDGKDKN